MGETLNTESACDLVLTDNATRQIMRLLARDNRDGYGLRIAVVNGGCSGFSYKLDFEKEPAAEDIVCNRGAIKLYIDRASAPFLQGTVIDFVSGMYGGGFKFSNPKATGTCGCGTSFSA